MDIFSFTSSHMSCNARTWNLTIRAEVEPCVHSSRDLKLYLKDPCFAYQFSFSHETKLSREQIVRAVNDPSDGLNVLKALGIRKRSPVRSGASEGRERLESQGQADSTTARTVQPICGRFPVRRQLASDVVVLPPPIRQEAPPRLLLHRHGGSGGHSTRHGTNTFKCLGRDQAPSASAISSAL